jgi:hypothetical protein
LEQGWEVLREKVANDTVDLAELLERWHNAAGVITGAPLII